MLVWHARSKHGKYSLIGVSPLLLSFRLYYEATSGSSQGCNEAQTLHCNSVRGQASCQTSSSAEAQHDSRTMLLTLIHVCSQGLLNKQEEIVTLCNPK